MSKKIIIPDENIYELIACIHHSLPISRDIANVILLQCKKYRRVAKWCCVCFEDIHEKIRLVPCGHTATCKKCITEIKICTMCMTPFEKYIAL
jgi:Zinc finger, C3HC4 type (RING finger)